MQTKGKAIKVAGSYRSYVNTRRLRRAAMASMGVGALVTGGGSFLAHTPAGAATSQPITTPPGSPNPVSVSSSSGTSSAAPTLWNGKILTSGGQPAQASIQAIAENPNTPAGATKNVTVPLADATTGPDGSFSIDVAPPSNIADALAPDGSFMVILWIKSGSNIQPFIRSMRLQAPASAHIAGPLLLAPHTPPPAGTGWERADQYSTVGDVISLNGGEVANPSATAASWPIGPALGSSASTMQSRLDPHFGPEPPNCYGAAGVLSTVNLQGVRTPVLNFNIAQGATAWQLQGTYTDTATTQFDAGYSAGFDVAGAGVSFAGDTSTSSSGGVSAGTQVLGSASGAVMDQLWVMMGAKEDHWECDQSPPYYFTVYYLTQWLDPSQEGGYPNYGVWYGSIPNKTLTPPSGNSGQPVAPNSYIGADLTITQSYSQQFAISGVADIFTGTAHVGWTNSNGYSVHNEYVNTNPLSTGNKGYLHVYAIQQPQTKLLEWSQTHFDPGELVAES